MTKNQGIGVVGVYVDDQDEALAFYVGKLGFQVHTDVRNGPYRWLTVQHPDQPDFQLGLFTPALPSTMPPRRRRCAPWWPRAPCRRWCCMWQIAALRMPGCATRVWSSRRSPWTGTAMWMRVFGTLRAMAGR